MLSHKRILIVEDEPLLALDLALTLEALGGETVGPVASVNHALRLLGAVPPVDGAILDVGLPDGLVTPVAEALTAERIPVVFHTAQSVPDAIGRGWPVCHKPATADDVIGALAKLLNSEPQKWC